MRVEELAKNGKVSDKATSDDAQLEADRLTKIRSLLRIDISPGRIRYGVGRYRQFLLDRARSLDLEARRRRAMTCADSSSLSVSQSRPFCTRNQAAVAARYGNDDIGKPQPLWTASRKGLYRNTAALGRRGPERCLCAPEDDIASSLLAWSSRPYARSPASRFQQKQFFQPNFTPGMRRAVSDWLCLYRDMPRLHLPMLRYHIDKLSR